MILLFIQLIICHAFGDFVFQNDYIANRKCDSGYILFIHGLIHGALIYLLTGNLLLLFIEIIVHMLIDYCKIKDIISFRKDQLLHILSKAIYLGLMI